MRRIARTAAVLTMLALFGAVYARRALDMALQKEIAAQQKTDRALENVLRKTSRGPELTGMTDYDRR